MKSSTYGIKSGLNVSWNQVNDHRLSNPDRLEALVRALDNDLHGERGRARAALVQLGRPAVPRLIELLRERSGRLRWGAARALAAIRAPGAATALVEILEDEMLEVRWSAESGIIDLGRDGLVALLHALITHSGSSRFREAAHRILTAMARGEQADIAIPVLQALNGPAPIIAAPVAAFTALFNLKPVT